MNELTISSPFDYKLCEKYIERATGSINSDNYHPMIYAIMDNNIEAFKQFYNNATIDEFLIHSLIDYCINNNNKLDIFDHINITAYKDKILDEFRDEYKDEFNKIFTDDVINRIWHN